MTKGPGPGLSSGILSWIDLDLDIAVGWFLFRVCFWPCFLWGFWSSNPWRRFFFTGVFTNSMYIHVTSRNRVTQFGNRLLLCFSRTLALYVLRTWSYTRFLQQSYGLRQVGSERVLESRRPFQFLVTCSFLYCRSYSVFFAVCQLAANRLIGRYFLLLFFPGDLVDTTGLVT